MRDGARLDEGRGDRAWLRVYLGYAPGVGKTYAMLAEGRRRRARGTDVVVGWVETYGRPRTIEALDGLEVVPPRALSYQGARVEEMDVDAVIARRPQVALVDELAHTNVPGSRNQMRYQDVIDLRAVGISVASTLNVQHLASLRETVRLLTGADPGGTVPDWLLETADELEMVDQSPEALRKRLRRGSVYARHRVAAALDGFFRTGNLVALRELTLRRMADHARAQRLRHGDGAVATGPEPGSPCETVLVCLPPSEQAQHVLRRGIRLAEALGARLAVLHVAEPGGALRRGGSAGNHEVTKALQLARELGAEVATAAAPDVAAEIAAQARRLGATQIVVGESAHSRLHELLRGSLVRELLRRTADADVHVVPRAEP